MEGQFERSAYHVRGLRRPVKELDSSSWGVKRSGVEEMQEIQRCCLRVADGV